MNSLNKERFREIKEEKSKKAVNIYKDWLKTKNAAEIKVVKNMLKEVASSGLKFTDLLREMEADGDQLLKIFSESWMSFGSIPSKAKKNFAKILYKSAPTTKTIKEEVSINTDQDGSVVTSIGMSYTPVTDRSNQMLSNVSATTRDLIIQIRHAIVAGNMQIAGELMKSGWGSLSLKQRNGLIEFVNAMDPYNKLTEVPKSKNTLKLKPLEKRSDKTKEEFISGIIKTAKEFMIVY